MQKVQSKPKVTIENLEQVNPNELLYKFLKENKITLDVQATETGVSYTGDGFVLNDKPLVKVVAKYE